MKRGLYTWMVFFVMVLSGAVITASAQENSVDLDELMNGYTHKVDEVLFSNLSFIQQTGGDNQVKVVQDQQGILSNLVEVDQLNRWNSSYIEQTGSGHSTLLLQHGSGNEANLWSAGSLTDTRAIQSGNGNRIDSYLGNTSTTIKTAVFVQGGDNNIIEFALSGNTSVETQALSQVASIRQTGNDLQVTAFFESLGSPLEIEQHSGPAGGMKVDVSTSDFYFPMKR